MRKSVFKSLTSIVLSLSIVLSVLSTVAFAEPVITELPDTDKTESEFNKSMFSAAGFATVANNGVAVNDRSGYIGTEHYRTVSNETEFLQAICDARSGAVKVIEITEDLDLGWNRLSEEAKSLDCIGEYEQKPHNGFTNPELIVSGLSQLVISDTKGLTIFSMEGATIYHAEWKLQGSSSDIVIRNLKFDEMWQWDESSDRLNISKETGWTFIKINGAKNVWIDHCSFTLAGDGNVDSENGASGVTLSWCSFGLPTDYNPDKNGMIYKTITYMEQLYEKGISNPDSRYKLLRDAGSTPEEIMAYTAMHLKLNLNGAGDKDFMDGVSNGVQQQDGNQRLNVTHAYNKYTNIGSRIPFIRQGIGHLYNCYIDNWEHMELHYSKDYFIQYGRYDLSQCLYARNGATVGADTCVFYGADEPLAGSEHQSDDWTTSYETMTDEWKLRLDNCYNRALIVNSKVSKVGTDEVYIGSSWDNNGENLFTSGAVLNPNHRYIWRDKSTIGVDRWSWTSVIEGVENMSKTDPPLETFTFIPTYEKLPYAYQTVPLEDVETVVDSYSGAGKVEMSAGDWLKISYSADEPVNIKEDTGITATALNLDAESLKLITDTMHQLNAEFVPFNATNTELVWSSSDDSVAEVLDSGLIITKKVGTATITAQIKDTDIKAICEVTVYQPITKISFDSKSMTIYQEDMITLIPSIEPSDATNKNLIWKSSNEKIAVVDENGIVTGISKGNATISCSSVENPDVKGSCTIKVKEGTNPDKKTKGDVTEDGSIDAADALKVLKHAAKIINIEDAALFDVADMNGDAVLDAADALIILQKAAKLI